ncbi:MAG: bifunctional pyr operon transcriptional regulator/uracil phosphoribosyltransferase PyrR [Gammaproteobacteria bacterium]|nr:bifunctional pyr operon transcriptional regulator/uracil phosphoribosyltransferase PyrR [Gammaproteobacteria bacterium]MDH5661210.1 bifunctional pyr operon transcriptional regulator/uracil phosphoribosyltransferase PyrR [Gammaproteobacteria bacterium]
MTERQQSQDLNTPALLDKLSSDLRNLLNSRNIENPLMIGIHTGGVWVAKELHKNLNIEQPLGTLNINFYRDDFTRIGMHPQVQPSNLPFNIDDQHIVLVDDVLHTGRTIRAALNEIFDFGRPASVMLAVLVERDCRELPISADVAATRITLKQNQHIKLSCDENSDNLLTLSIEEGK